ncbi:Branched-chain amino acid aminotransferase [Minicystis rosea]|nr:Branched-chain amino acid aminotransferase [Minicystis rosea]
MVDKVKSIWMEGEFVAWDDAQLHLLTHTMHYGLGAFEGIRAYKRSDGATAIFRLHEHINRLFDSCKLMMIEPRFNREQVSAACGALLKENRMDEAYLRPIVWVGDGAMGVYAPDNPIRTAVVAWRWGAYLGAGAVEKGIRVKVSSWARHHIHVSLAKGKIMGQYTNSTLAKREAKMAGYDEAVLMDVQGYVSEGSGENLFIVKRGKLITPPLSASILEGVTRDTILTLAREEGIPVSEEMVTRDQLYLADEAFFTGTAAEVTPIREVDNRQIGEGSIGPITKRLQQRYFDVVKGSDTSHPEWLTRV